MGVVRNEQEIREVLRNELISLVNEVDLIPELDRMLDDFIEEGDAEQDPMEALPHVNNLLQNLNWNVIVYSQDWHPSNHISFFEHARNPDRELAPEDKSRKLRPFDIVRFVKPVSTIQRVEGAHYIKKGADVYVDAYSAFSDNCGIKQSELEMLLRKNDINAVIGCGLAYDICVMHTLKDASKHGFLTCIVKSGSKGLSSLKMDEANKMFQKRGVAIIDDEMARLISRREAFPIEWIRLLVHQAQNELHGKK
uniref:nicotinamidase n=1 Tax=Caenorhabditis tropicalis TaxID=1561998 RepID=A0A1I7TD45_9PELO